MEKIIRNNHLEFLSHKCEMSLGDLFLGFLVYYAKFDPEKYGIAMGQVLDRMDNKLYFTRESNSRYQPLLVQDPFDQRNAARAIITKKHLRNIIKESEDSLRKIEECTSQSLADLCQKPDLGVLLEDEETDDNFGVKLCEAVLKGLVKF